MATNTTNYNWTKPDYEDDADIKDLNDNFDGIDAQVKAIDDQVQLNKNNISFTAQSGVKNFCPSKTGANTSGNKWVIGRTGDNTEPINLPIGSYIFTATSTSTGSGQCQIKLKFDDGTTQNTQTFDFGASMTLSFTTSKKVVGYGIYANPAPVAFDNMMIRPSFTDSIYDEYAMSNAELTAKEQVNENNISLLETMNGAKNIVSISTIEKVSADDLTITENNGIITITGTQHGNANIGIPISLTAGRYYLSGCPTGGGNNTYRVDLRATTGGNLYVDTADTGNGFAFTVDSDAAIYYNIRIASDYTVSGLQIKPMIITKAAYDAGFTDYQPYALSNVELTAAIQALQAQLANQ